MLPGKHGLSFRNDVRTEVGSWDETPAPQPKRRPDEDDNAKPVYARKNTQNSATPAPLPPSKVLRRLQPLTDTAYRGAWRRVAGVRAAGIPARHGASGDPAQGARLPEHQILAGGQQRGWCRRCCYVLLNEAALLPTFTRSPVALQQHYNRLRRRSVLFTPLLPTSPSLRRWAGALRLFPQRRLQSRHPPLQHLQLLDQLRTRHAP